MYNILKIWLFIAILTLDWGFIQEVKASHIAGATISYTYLHHNTYQVDVSWVRDCSGITFGSPNIKVEGCNGWSMTINPMCGQNQTITPVCGNVSCANPNGVVVYEEIHCSVTVALPSTPCGDYVFSTSAGWRNGAIQTINNPGTEHLYVEATLDNTSGNHSSPTFGALPLTTICAGETFNFNNQVQSSNGGTLTYSVITPMSSSTNDVVYMTGYSASNPYQGPFNLDPSTGAISGTPPNPTVTVFTVMVTETDANGNVISTVMRDVQLNIISCKNAPPIAVPGIIDDTICSGESYNLMITGSDADGDNITMSWGNEIAGATFNITNNGSPSPIGTFAWTPSNSDLGSHSFTVTVQDDACPVNGANTYTYKLFVKDCCDTFAFDLISCYPLETGKMASFHSPVLGSSSSFQRTMEMKQKTGNLGDEKPEVVHTCDPCLAGYYDVWPLGINGIPYDGTDNCMEIEWIENGVVVSTQPGFRATPDIRYTVRVTNLCTGCIWKEDFWFCCIVPDPGFNVSTQCVGNNFIITVTNTSPFPNSRFYLYSAHTPCTADNCLVDYQNPDQKQTGNFCHLCCAEELWFILYDQTR